MNNITLWHGDCLELMKDIPAGSVDLILCDPPYGITNCEWDKALNLSALWEEYKRIIKDNGAVILFSVQPFTTDLIQSNRRMFRYEIIWEKTRKTGFYNANKMPLRAHENLLLFYKKLPTYNPQKYRVERKDIGRIRHNKEKISALYGHLKAQNITETGERYPHDVIKFSNWNGVLFGKTDNARKHPTQKPVLLLEYLIKTYSNERDTVLDNCMGSGSTGVACVNTGRKFIGIELDGRYFRAAEQRITEAQRLREVPPEEKNGGKE